MKEDQDLFDAMRLTKADDINLWPRVRPQRFDYVFPFASAALALLAAWIFTSPRFGSEWPINGKPPQAINAAASIRPD